MMQVIVRGVKVARDLNEIGSRCQVIGERGSRCRAAGARVAWVDHAIAVGIVDQGYVRLECGEVRVVQRHRAVSWPGASILNLYKSMESFRIGRGVIADEILESGVGRAADVAGGLQRIAGVVGGDAHEVRRVGALLGDFDVVGAGVEKPAGQVAAGKPVVGSYPGGGLDSDLNLLRIAFGVELLAEQLDLVADVCWCGTG